LSFVSHRENAEAASAVARTLDGVEWPEPVERVARTVRDAAVDVRIEEFAAGTPTAEAAARAVGAELAQIVKSLVFVCDARYVLALVPGNRRADPAKVAAAAQATSARIATADEVKAATGFEPGGVAPFPVPRTIRVFVDRRLLGNEEVWVGAGTARHMAGLAPFDLVRVAHAEPADLTS
jgi:prolyl-tRNA editing enzyme YbaK/EbsC (Cys-tRNA(Pro) deacylase)